jgi:chromosomal replication initiation ATPase DnaA|tara:strand:- start:207 stop:569 length:363 start_codon:yes stop_codon:yes gene_type:complete
MTPFPEIEATDECKPQRWPPAIDGIIKAVCRRAWPYQGMEHQIMPRQLLGQQRSQPIARVRHAGYWLASKYTPASLPVIGRAFGGRDHTTIIHGCRRCEEIMVAEPAFRATVEAIAEELA